MRAAGRRMPRLAAWLGLSLCAASCGPGLFLPGLLGIGHASFEDAARDYPEFGEVAEAFDRLAFPAPDEKERERQLDLFAEVFRIAHDEHIDPVTPQSLVLLALEGFEEAEGEAALHGLAGAPAPDADAPDADAAPAGPPENPLAADNLMSAGLSKMMTGLDPHSAYLDPRTYREMLLRSRGKFGGIGIEVTMTDGLVRIIAPLEDTPGARAGLQAGDLITHVDGEPILGLSLTDAVRLMRGKPGSAVRLGIRRPPETESFEVSVVRAVVQVRPVRARAEGRVGYLRVTTFNERAEAGVRRALRDLAAEIDDEIGYVLDLRGNPGGLLDQALGVANAFLTGGEVVSTRGRGGESVRRFPAGPGDLSDGLPVVVLIDDISASAAEIVAGALQDHDRALVIGARSFGKGSVQSVIPVSGGGAVRVTAARYYTPSGRSIQATGIVPDILADAETAAPARESDLDNALPAEVEKAEAAAARLADVCPDRTEAEDPPLACAIHLLEGQAVVAAAPG